MEPVVNPDLELARIARITCLRRKVFALQDELENAYPPGATDGPTAEGRRPWVIPLNALAIAGEKIDELIDFLAGE